MKSIEPLHSDIKPQDDQGLSLKPQLNPAENIYPNTETSSINETSNSPAPIHTDGQNMPPVQGDTVEQSSYNLTNRKHLFSKKKVIVSLAIITLLIVSVLGYIILLPNSMKNNESKTVTRPAPTTADPTPRSDSAPNTETSFLETCKDFENDADAINNARILEAKKMIQAFRKLVKDNGGIIPSGQDANKVYLDYVSNIVLPDCKTKEFPEVVNTTPTQGHQVELVSRAVCSNNEFTPSNDPYNFAAKVMLFDGKLLCRDVRDYKLVD